MAAEEQSQQPSQQQQVPGEPAEGKAQWLGTDAARCKEMVDKATSRNPVVKFMLQKMEEVRHNRAGKDCSAATPLHTCVVRPSRCSQLLAPLLCCPAVGLRGRQGVHSGGEVRCRGEQG